MKAQGTGGAIASGLTGKRRNHRAAVLASALSGIAAISCVRVPSVLGQMVPVRLPPSVGVPADRIRVEPISDAELAPLIDQLGNADLRVRDQASAQILEDPRVTLQVIERTMKDSSRPLSLEQRTRLLVVARERFLKGDRAALGFQFGGQLKDRVVVGQTYPKFPSYKVLEVGDMIVGVEGVDISSPTGRAALQAIIISRDPGDTLALTVRRGAEKLDLNVPLGRFGDLEQPGMPVQQQRMSRPPDALMERAWKVRARAMTVPNKPIGGFAEAWKPLSQEDRDRRRDLNNKRMNTAMERPSVTGGGTAHVAMTSDDPSEQSWQILIRQQPQLRVIRQAGMVAMFGEFEDESPFARSTPAEELGELARAKAQAAMEAKQLSTTKPRVPDEYLLVQADIAKRVQLIDRQIEAITAEIRERGEPVPQVKVPVNEPPVELKEEP